MKKTKTIRRFIISEPARTERRWERFFTAAVTGLIGTPDYHIASLVERAVKVADYMEQEYQNKFKVPNK